MSPVTFPSPILELAFEDPGTEPNWIDFSSVLKRFSFHRGRSSERDQTEAGRIEVVLDDPTRQLDPANTASPYYPFVRPMRRIRLKGELPTTSTPFRMRSSHMRGGDSLRGGGAITIDLISGFTDSFSPRLGLNELGEVVIEATDAFAIFALADFDYDLGVDAVSLSPALFDLSGARVARVLDAVSWSETDRRIDPGVWHIWVADTPAGGSTVIPISGTALQHLQDVAVTEGGAVFMGPDGAVVFYDSARDPIIGSDDTWGDLAPEHQCYEISLDYDMSRLWNAIAVSAPTQATLLRSNATSIARYFERSQTFQILAASNIPFSQTAVEVLADELIERYREPRLRITALRPRGQDDWVKVLGKNLLDRITVRKRPVAGSMISQDSAIEGITITHDHSKPWQVTWTLSALPVVYPSLLTVNQQSLETDTTGWVAESGAAISRTTAQAKLGTASLLIAPTGGDAKVTTTPNNSIAVIPAATYRATAFYRAKTQETGGERMCHVEIDWRTAANVFISTSTGTSLRDRSSKFSSVELEATAPGTAAFAVLRLVVEAATVALDHYADAIAFNRSS